MMVHRLLVHYLSGGASENRDLYEIRCEHSSGMEQRAAYAERASIRYKMVEFMLDKLGCEFEGRISGVTERGLYVELDDTHIEGMVALRDMTDDYYSFSEADYCIAGRSTRRIFTLGDAVRVCVLRADLARRQLDFGLLGSYGGKGRTFIPVVDAVRDSDTRKWKSRRR
jgi:ribonuclease R